MPRRHCVGISGGENDSEAVHVAGSCRQVRVGMFCLLQTWRVGPEKSLRKHSANTLIAA